ncbi:EPIDERMAL PATTERNING FACTOR protein [Salix suchowensis]|nr:EPIDERMAL PATTERNING FACTOR protein [Salix suchowensis]
MGFSSKLDRSCSYSLEGIPSNSRAITKLLEPAPEEKIAVKARTIGSRPPRCDKRCNSCEHCEAVQVPIATQAHSLAPPQRLLSAPPLPAPLRLQTENWLTENTFQESIFRKIWAENTFRSCEKFRNVSIY